MIPCHLCGKDASLGWIKGYIPAPDSQKLALCAEHDTMENRRRLLAAWGLLMLRNIQTATHVAASRTAQDALRMLTVHFTAGGSLSLPCITCEMTPYGSLKAVGPDGAASFFPMQHVRRYDMAPMPIASPAPVPGSEK